MNNLFNAYGKITRWPKKNADKKSVIEFLAAKFIFDKIYTEKEVNGIIQQSHLFQDIALLRRELISRRYLARKNDCSEYWKITGQ